MTRASVNDTGSPCVRAIVLLGCFVAGSGAGAWLGLAAAVVSGSTSADLPHLPGGNLAFSALALVVLAVLSVLAQNAGGIGMDPAARARAEGRGARNSLLLAAAFSAFAVVFAVFALGGVSPLALSPAVLAALTLSLAAVRRDPLLRLVAICAGSLYALAGLAVSLAKAF